MRERRTMPGVSLFERAKARRPLVVAVTLAAALAEFATAWPAGAQTYPDRAITMIVPFAAGGAADTNGRIIADAMSRQLGQSVVVENVGGAGGATGSARGMRANPDG